ncbi:MAG: radical SAM family heme chaperone HemW [Chloroflexi bacterium AL-W]|nr:radical SAM family heme chaperone HemW [Chloroflexi bacterium AL-N1]NOK68027.1 radical SAM family heme chaperone HemW [Chloroflexi bacterium AL-N10]NOK73367.1 radical SAM family heme chaperone HemW [Chloroflexi bacterium AL-N5]NOK83281.1 radical SAM family heme chaperone HemW [Chloroflexi bacterium AL-W]NOK87698.1 radical SAM family heme chaperone HemW [Chloroflexi bacterium AL-N15]
MTACVRHLYIHIPFCHRRCSYCDFNTYANMEDRMDTYVDALCTELDLRRQSVLIPGDQAQQSRQTALRVPTPLAPPVLRSDLLPTVFLGGGTPTMLPLELMEKVLTTANHLIPLDQAEVTIEANPGIVLGRDYLRSLRDLGINRISMGVQSLHDPTLRVLGRTHTAAEARTSYEDTRIAGFERINLDFIFGLPDQTVEQWDETLRDIVTWGADHFSLYSLILEEETPLYAQILNGHVTVPDDDTAGEMYELAMQHFDEAGYVHYEISNWARDQGAPSNEHPVLPGQASHHNMAYWFNTDYLACGAGAHGHVFPNRYYDILGIDEYIAQIRQNTLPTHETIPLTEHDLYAETMFMGLRLNVGVSHAHFRDRCGVELNDVYGDLLDELWFKGLVERDELGVRLTKRGWMLGNQVFARFVI